MRPAQWKNGFAITANAKPSNIPISSAIGIADLGQTYGGIYLVT
mgnify:FL=1|jgi:hypothetical protein